MTREEFVKLLEAKIVEVRDPANVPFGFDPSEAKLWRRGRLSILQWVLEMLPERFD